MNGAKKSLIFLALFLAIVGGLLFSACAKAEKSRHDVTTGKGESAMAEKASPEILAANEKIIKEHLDSAGLNSGRRSNEGIAKSISASFGYSVNTRIVDVSSKITEGNNVDLTLTDEMGAVYTIGLTKDGYFDTIRDGTGKVVFAKIM